MKRSKETPSSLPVKECSIDEIFNSHHWEPTGFYQPIAQAIHVQLRLFAFCFQMKGVEGWQLLQNAVVMSLTNKEWKNKINIYPQKAAQMFLTAHKHLKTAVGNHLYRKEKDTVFWFFHWRHPIDCIRNVIKEIKDVYKTNKHWRAHAKKGKYKLLLDPHQEVRVD